MPNISIGNGLRVFGLAACALVIGGLGFLEAFANVARQTAPVLVARTVPFDALAPTIAVDEALVMGRQKLSNPVVAAAARKTLLSEPLSARALRILGFVADDRGNAAQAHNLMELSSRVSRRELGTQLWKIEQAVRLNDVPEALRQYDMTLRGVQQSKDILFPVLLASLSDPEIRHHMAPYIRQDPPWLIELLNRAVSEERETASVAELLARAGGLPRTPAYKGIEASLISQLVAQHAPAKALAFFESIPGADRHALDTGALSPSTANVLYAPLTWASLNSPTINSVYGDPIRGLQIEVSPGAKGTVIRRAIAVTPGRYVLASTFTLNAPSKSQKFLWQIDCILPDAYKGLWNSGELEFRSNLRFQGVFAIPDGCPAQQVSLFVANEDPEVDFVGDLVAVGIHRR